MAGIVGLNKKKYNIILVISTFSLFFSVTNLLPFSVFISVCIILLPIMLIRNKVTVPKFVVVLLLLFIYFALSTLLYSPGNLFKYRFYRYDGNFFVTYAPLLLLAFCRIKCDVEAIIDRFLGFASWLNLVFMIIWKLTGDTIFGNSIGESYRFLFIAHNAAGGFIGTIMALAVGFYYARREKKYLHYILINLFGLMLSDSRGSILGVVMGIGLFVINKKKPNWKLDIKIFIMIFFAFFFMEGIIYSIMKNTEDLSYGLDSFSLPLIFYDSVFYDVLKIITRSWTIINRMFHLWPYAILLIFSSPIVGTGFGSYNDNPATIEGIFGVYSRKIPVAIVNSDAHAHNSFLHIFAETGLVGILLLFLFLYLLRNYLLKIKEEAVKYGIYIAGASIVISSFTEHRLFTPSQVVPFTIILGITVASNNYTKRENGANRQKENADKKPCGKVSYETMAEGVSWEDDETRNE